MSGKAHLCWKHRFVTTERIPARKRPPSLPFHLTEGMSNCGCTAAATRPQGLRRTVRPAFIQHLPVAPRFEISAVAGFRLFCLQRDGCIVPTADLGWPDGTADRQSERVCSLPQIKGYQVLPMSAATSRDMSSARQTFPWGRRVVMSSAAARALRTASSVDSTAAM